MKSLSLFKTAAAVTVLSTLAFSTTAAEKELSIEQYMDAVVSANITETMGELNNQSTEAVLNTAYSFAPQNNDEGTLVAKVKVTVLSAPEVAAIKGNGAE